MPVRIVTIAYVFVCTAHIGYGINIHTGRNRVWQTGRKTRARAHTHTHTSTHTHTHTHTIPHTHTHTHKPHTHAQMHPPTPPIPHPHPPHTRPHTPSPSRTRTTVRSPGPTITRKTVKSRGRATSYGVDKSVPPLLLVKYCNGPAQQRETGNKTKVRFSETAVEPPKQLC